MSKQSTFNINDLPEFIFGAEGEGDNADSQSNSDQSNSESSSDSSEDHDESLNSSSKGDSSANKHDDQDDPKTIALKKALDVERANAKAATKRADALQKAQDDRDLASKSEAEQAQIRAERAEAKVTKAAEGLLRVALNSAIKKSAANFIDPEDAISGVDLSKINWTQDEEDPSEIEIDTKSVEIQVKALAAKKPHYLNKGTEDGQPSGSQFGGSKRQNKSNDDKYRSTYPSL